MKQCGTRHLLPWFHFFVVPLVMAATLTGCGKGGAPDEDKEAPKPVVSVAVAPVKQGEIAETVAATGSLSPLPGAESKVAPLAAGRLRNVLVKAGDTVTKGQVIALLDPSTTPGQLQQAEAAVRVAQTTLQQTRTNYLAQLRTQASSEEQARLNVQSAEVALKKLRTGSRPQEIVEAEANEASAQAALTDAEQNLARSNTLFSEGLLARKDLEAAQEVDRTARATLTTASQALSLARQGNRPEDIKTGEVALDQARQQLRAAQAQSIVNRSKAQDVQIAAGQLASAEGALKAAQAQSLALTITAPVSGTVTSRTTNPGESVDVTTGVVTIADLDKVRLLLSVPPSAIGDIKVGQDVSFTTDAEPDHLRTARVTVVGRAVDAASNTVSVEAVADNPDHSLRDDGFVKAKIVTETHKGSLLIPTSALVEKEDKVTVYVAGADNQAHAHEVTVGVRNNDQVEIRSGLKLGDKVITTGAYELDDGTEIKVGE